MRPTIRYGSLLGLVLAMLLAFPSTVPSAPEKTDPQGEKKAEAPNPLELKADLGIWAVVVFLLLLFILYKAAWGPMLEGLHKREQFIKAAADEAKKARQETEKVRADFKAQMDKAYAAIPKMMEEARREAAALKEELRTQSNKDIQADRQRLRREIDTARDQALQNIWNQAAQLATVISGKVLARIMSPDDHNRLLDLALEELQTSGQRYREEFLKR